MDARKWYGFNLQVYILLQKMHLWQSFWGKDIVVFRLLVKCYLSIGYSPPAFIVLTSNLLQ